jgi:hypothetical protein
MTEDEAKTKWCPMRQPDPYASAHCMGSACMIWRWSLVTSNPSLASASFEPSKTHGNCGLADAKAEGRAP